MRAASFVSLGAALLVTSCARLSPEGSASTVRDSTEAEPAQSGTGPGAVAGSHERNGPGGGASDASLASAVDGAAPRAPDPRLASNPFASAADGARGAATDGWASVHPGVVSALQSSRPLVVAVVVPLCSNHQIACGGQALGNPSRLETNLYWGALYGARRFFDRPGSGWERVDVDKPLPPSSPEAAAARDPALALRPSVRHPAGDEAIVLERAVYRRSAAAERWGRSSPVELLVVLEAVHGQSIDAGVDRFWWLATRGGELTFRDGERVRHERVVVAGYAGHNRLLDGKRLPERARAEPDAREASGEGAGPREAGLPAALPTFVLACLSERFFGAPLREAGADTLLTTGAFMAPEGYVIDAVARAIGDNAAREEIRVSAMAAAMRWQGLGRADASRTFIAPGDE